MSEFKMTNYDWGVLSLEVNPPCPCLFANSCQMDRCRDELLKDPGRNIDFLSLQQDDVYNGQYVRGKTGRK